MRIKRMTASFGRLQNATLELEEGLNLIEAPNEAGKSTWAAFLRAMLYGIPTKERDKQGFIAEKNRYLPWNGAPMEGVIDLVWQGHAITLRRSPRGNNPFGKFEAVMTATGEKITKLTGDNAGELLLGVPREVFERSAFVGQGATVVDGAPALEKRIAALVSSGEEDVSSSETRLRLKEWQNRRKHNRTGLIPKLEEELAGLDDTLARQSKARHMAAEARREVEALTAEKKELETALEALRSLENEEKRRQYEAAQAALAEAEAAAKSIHAELTRQGTPPNRETLRKAQEDLSYLNTLTANIKQAEGQRAAAEEEAKTAREKAGDPAFAGLSPEEAWEQASGDAGQITQPPGRGVKFLQFFSILLLLGAAGGVLVGLLGPIEGRLFALIPAGISAFVGILALVWIGGAKRNHRVKAEDILARYHVDSADDILSSAAAYREKCAMAVEAERNWEALETSMARMMGQRDVLKRDLLALIHTFAPTVTDTFGVSAAISRALSLEEKLSTAMVRLEGAKNLAESLPRPEASTGAHATAAPALAGRSGNELNMRLSAVEQELVRRNSVLAMAKGELNTLGDPARFQARREANQDELNRRSQEYDALALALECLDQADSNLQSRFSPALNQRSGEMMSALTGGKYSAIALTRDFEATAEEVGALLPRRAITLSRGTADQLYLAVRLAVCELALPGDDPAPLVLDDALANFDDGRLGLALDCLLEIAQHRQILLFTCHSREGAWLDGKPGVCRAALQS